MKLPTLNNREQLLLALTVCVILIGGYVWFRYLPAHRLIGALNQSVQDTEKRLKTTEIPEEPDEDLDRLNAQIEEQQRLMTTVKAQADNIERRLAPVDSREIIVDISQLARQAQVHIRINEAYKSATQGTAIAPTQPQATGKKAKRNRQATPAPAPVAAATSSNPLILPATDGWVARMSPGTAFQRPLQRLQLEGSYLSLNQFIHGLDELRFQVTPLRVTIEKMPVLAPPGYPQVLLAEIILAL